MTNNHTTNHTDNNFTEVIPNPRADLALGMTTVLPHSPAAPVIPVELYREIFLWTITKKPACLPQDFGGFPEFDPTALRLAAVSRKWRAIALSIPELWSTIALYAPSHKVVKRIRLYISRAGKRACFTLYLTLPRWYGEGYDSGFVLNEILELLLTHAERWRSVFFHFGSRRAPSMLLEVPKERLQNLRDVAFSSSWSQHRDAELHKFWKNLYALKNLRTVDWGYSSPHELIASAPFEQLTKFTLPQQFIAAPKVLFGILLRCGQLEHLTIDAFSGWADYVYSSGGEMIVLPRLRVLIVKGCCALSLPPFFERISAPALEELAIHVIPQNTRKTLLRNFLARSGCSLKRLHVQGIWGTNDIDNLVAADTYGDSDKHYLDKLERLTFPGNNLDWTIFEPRVNPCTGKIRVPFPSLVTLEAPLPYKDGVVGLTLLAREATGAAIWRYGFNVTPGGGVGTRNHPIDERCFEYLKGSSGMQVIKFPFY